MEAREIEDGDVRGRADLMLDAGLASKLEV